MLLRQDLLVGQAQAGKDRVGACYKERVDACEVAELIEAEDFLPQLVCLKIVGYELKVDCVLAIQLFVTGWGDFGL